MAKITLITLDEFVDIFEVSKLIRKDDRPHSVLLDLEHPTEGRLTTIQPLSEEIYLIPPHRSRRARAVNVEILSVAEYTLIADDIDATETVMLAGTWPITIGTHPAYSGAPILIAHVRNGAFLVALNPVPDPDPDWMKHALTIGPGALQ